MNKLASIILALVLALLVTASLEAKQYDKAANGDDCERCGPTKFIGCRRGKCYYKCMRRCMDKDNKFYYESVKFTLDGV